MPHRKSLPILKMQKKRVRDVSAHTHTVCMYRSLRRAESLKVGLILRFFFMKLLIKTFTVILTE